MRFRLVLPALLATAPLAADGLDAQCAQVAKAIAGWQAENRERVAAGRPARPINLILGATATQARQFGDGHWIFLDVASHGDAAAPHLNADFNDPDQLGRVAKAVRGSVDAIFPDHSVTPFAEWKQDHLDLFARMLAPGGVFYIGTVLDHVKTFAKSYVAIPRDAGTAELAAHFRVLEKEGAAGCLPIWLEAPQALVLRSPEEQSAALALAREQLLKPVIRRQLEQSFGLVERVVLVPRFLKRHPECRAGGEYFACSNPGGPRELAAEPKAGSRIEAKAETNAES